MKGRVPRSHRTTSERYNGFRPLSRRSQWTGNTCLVDHKLGFEGEFSVGTKEEERKEVYCRGM